jgi:hypothetical protein
MRHFGVEVLNSPDAATAAPTMSPSGCSGHQPGAGFCGRDREPVSAGGLCARSEPTKNSGGVCGLSYHLAKRQNEREIEVSLHTPMPLIATGAHP